MDLCWNVIWGNYFVSDEIAVGTEKISSWLWDDQSLLRFWLFLLICLGLSFPLPSLLMHFSTPIPVALKIASTKTIKMPVRHFLPGWTSWVKVFVNPRDVILAWLSCLHFTHCCWKTFHFYAQSSSLHCFYKERQILALRHSMWPVEAGQVGWISTCVDCRVNSGFATTEVQLFYWFIVPWYLRSC